MREEKTSIVSEMKTKLEKAPYVILTDFTGLTVDRFSELRTRLSKANARAMVVKNSLLRKTLKELNQPELNGSLQGPTAMVYGDKDISVAASVLKKFYKEFEKPKIKVGILDRAVLTAKDVEAIADLPSREVLMAQLLGVLNAPATKFVRLMNTPATQIVRVLKGKAEKAA